MRKNPLKRQKVSHSFTCKKCGNEYKHRKKYDEHVRRCTRDTGEGVTLQRALKMAHTMVYLENEMNIYTRHDSHPLLSLVQVDGEEYRRTVKRGWARRPKWGQA